jgi:1,4-dihydroxy-2-naphthoyl-CoA synthase
MLYKAIALGLVAVFLNGSIAAQDQPQSASQTVANMQQVLNKAREKDKAVKVILNKKIDNQTKFSGKVSEISDSGFVVTNEKTGTTKRLAYEDVRQIKRKGLSKAAKILIVSGVVVGTVVGVGVALACHSDAGPNCFK